MSLSRRLAADLCNGRKGVGRGDGVGGEQLIKMEAKLRSWHSCKQFTAKKQAAKRIERQAKRGRGGRGREG